MNMKEKIYEKEWFWLCVALVVFMVNQLPFLVDMRPVMYDEGWYGSTAYSFAHGQGFLNTAVGTRGNSNFVLPLLTAGFMRLFGYNLLAIRLPAVFCGVLTLLLLSLCMRQMRIGWKAQALTYFLFVSLPIFNTVFRFGRPECVAIMFTLGGIWFYLRYRECGSWSNMIGLSVFVWLAGCSHPYALLLFALLGVLFFVRAFKSKNKNALLQLLPLAAAALLAVVSIYWVSKTYNPIGESYVKDRFSTKNIGLALPAYFGEAFMSKASLSLVPLIAVLVFESLRDAKNGGLAWVALAFFVLFPFVFSTDLMMVGLGLDYVALVGLVLVVPLLERLLERNGGWTMLCFCAYCMGCLGISYYFNYGVKYEKANTVLAKELPSVVPVGSKVFGPLRQWPMLMQTDYQSEHTVLPIGNVDEYDYFIVNSQDVEFYSSYEAFIPIDESKLELIYERPTRQYGTVQVYKCKSIN